MKSAIFNSPGCIWDSKSFLHRRLKSYQQNHGVIAWNHIRITKQLQSIHLFYQEQWVCRFWAGLLIRLLTNFWHNSLGAYLNKDFLLDSYQGYNTIPDLSAWATTGASLWLLWTIFVQKVFDKNLICIGTNQWKIRKMKALLLYQLLKLT